MTGVFPVELGQLNLLETLELSGNDLSGSIPPSIGNLSNCQFLFLNDNSFESLPAEMGNMSGLTTLKLQRNNLTQLPDEMVNLTGLTTLDLGTNQLCVLSPGVALWATENDADWATTQDCEAPQFTISGSPLSGSAPLPVNFNAVNTGTSSIYSWL